MVDMLVRVEHRVDPTDPRAEELRAEIGGGVDEERAPRQTEENARPHPPVTRVVTRADRTGAPHHRHADTGAGAEEDHLAGGIAKRGCGHD